MNIIYFLMPIAFLLGFGFLAAFLRACLKGQYEDLDTPAHRILIEQDQNMNDHRKQERKIHVVRSFK